MPLSFPSAAFLPSPALDSQSMLLTKLKMRRRGARLAPANRVVGRRRVGRFSSHQPHFSIRGPSDGIIPIHVL
jgi:hypothetical protein